MDEKLSISPSELNQTLELIRGEDLEIRINKLAEIAEEGKIGEGGSRLALSREDLEARWVLKGWMEEAGMEVKEHPLGLIGTYRGVEAELPAVALGSHFDTVFAGGCYDGAVGTIGAIATVQAFNKLGIRFPRSLKVFAFTGEESSRFNTALFGSRGMFLGLSKEVLAMKREEDISIEQALQELGFDPKDVEEPVVSSEALAAFIELHVEQGIRLEQGNLDVAAIEAIAAPDRRVIEIGQPLVPKTKLGKVNKGLRINIEGKGGHSGATPMGREFRADGLQPTADLLMVLSAAFEKKFKEKSVGIFINGLEIEGAALNKIPGRTSLEVVFSGKDGEAVGEAKQFLEDYLVKLNKFYSQDSMKQFEKNPISQKEISPEEISEGELRLFSLEQILPNYKTAGRVVKAVENICNRYGERKIVRTIGTFSLKEDGTIALGLDVRGIDGQLRNGVMKELGKKFEGIANRENVKVEMSDSLPGSGEPTVMNSKIVAVIKQEADSLGLKSEIMFSPAGHDTQNVARAGIPSAMIFIPSRNGGVSHCPDEYSTAKDLEHGTKVLTAAIYKLTEVIY